MRRKYLHYFKVVRTTINTRFFEKQIGRAYTFYDTYGEYTFFNQINSQLIKTVLRLILEFLWPEIAKRFILKDTIPILCSNHI